MVVRRMTLEDVRAVFEISESSFSESWSLESIEKEVDNPVASYFVAERDGEVVGYAGLWHVLDEGEVINIAVSERVRKQKIGQKLLEQLLEEARDYDLDVIHLEVRESNKPARKLYEKFHFEVIAKRKAYYHLPTEDAVIMEWVKKKV